MKNIILSFFFTIVCTTSFSQIDSVKFYIDRGISLHDNGKFTEAISMYDNAIRLDDKNFTALYEKSFTYYYIKNYDECIALSKQLIKNFKSNSELKNVYANYGSSLDDEGNTKEALSVYNDGLKAFPESFLLWFNKGLTFLKSEQEDDASTCFQAALKYKPLHASSNYYLSYIEEKKNRIASLLTNTVFLLVEQKGVRAEKAVARQDKLLMGNVSKGANGNITIAITTDAIDSKKKENNFSTVELMMSLMGSMDLTDSLKNKPVSDKLANKFEILASSLSDKKKAKGFYWEHYAPFLVALNKNNLSNVAAHLCLAASDDDANRAWLSVNEVKIGEFYKWLKAYEWPK
jgi:tetratricopeptide (TPR) repeat protein